MIKSSIKDKLRDIRGFTVSKIGPLVDAYTEWYAENGLALPPEYATDPSAWTEVLRKMQRAFMLLQTQNTPGSELYEAAHKWDAFNERDADEISLLEQEIKDGLAAFGKYLFWMQDSKID